jgi:hypothetical protein
LEDGVATQEWFDYCWILFKYKVQLKLNASELSRPLDFLKNLQENRHFSQLNTNDRVDTLGLNLDEPQRTSMEEAVDDQVVHGFPIDIKALVLKVAEMQDEISQIDTLLSDTIQIVFPYLR